MAKVISAKEIAEVINLSVKEKISALCASRGRGPRLVSLSVGHNESARIYVNMQEKLAQRVGVEFSQEELDPGIDQDALIDRVRQLNSDERVTAIIVQQPLPEGIDHSHVVAAIVPEKDAEGLHPYNLGKILRREADIVPCTPGAIMKILNVEGVDLYGKEVVIIGHSAIVGKPLSLMMLNETATTTVCHIGTAEKGDILFHARRADVLVVAVGCARMVKGDWVKKGAVVIDVGINKVDGGIVGDVDMDAVSKKAAVVTPVPGGVGPITVSILMRNVLRAYSKQGKTAGK